MLDFGTTASHSNAITFTDADYGPFIDAMTHYTILIPIRPRAAGWTGTRHILGKFTGTSGWFLQTINSAGNNLVRVAHGSGGATGNPGDCTTVLTNGTSYTLILWWDGAIFRYIFNGVSEGDLAFTKAIDANAVALTLGNAAALGLGAQIATGPTIIWPNYCLTDAEIAQANAGVTVPAYDRAIFFHRGIVVPGIDEIQGFTGTQQGSVGLVTDATLDAFFPLAQTIPQHRHVATHQLRQSVFDDHRHTLRVPLWLALKLELLDPFNVSHDSLLRSATHLTSIAERGGTVDPYQLMQRWQRQIVDLVGVTVDYKTREAVLTFQDMEKFLATYFCSERIVGTSTDSYVGLAQSDLGGTITVDRNTKGYIIQQSNIVYPISDATIIESVGPYIAKRNYLGLLCEDSTVNAVTRSVFDQGLTGYTTVLNGGSITADGSATARKYFPTSIVSQEIIIARADNANDTYFYMAGLSVAAGDNHRRVAIIYSGAATGNIPSFFVQRASDSWYFNNTSGAWQAGAVWNALPDTYDATNGFEIASYFQSKKIPATTTTYTVAVGLNGAVIPGGGAVVDIGYLGLHKGPLRFSPVPTFGAAVTTTADTVKDVLIAGVSDPVRQLHWAGHGTIELSMVAEQDVDDIPLSTKLALLYIQYGSDTKDYDAVCYEKPGAGAARFTYERWRDIAGTSTLDARATKDIDIVRGTTYHVCARNIGADQELGAAIRTMMITVNGQNGVSAVAAALHSTSEKQTEVWTGCAPASTGFTRSMNVINDVCLQPRVITNEEVQT